MTTNPFSTAAQRPRSPADGQKFDLETARRLVGQFADMIRPACARLVVAGSIRRGTPYVKDAELVAIPTPDLLTTLDQLVAQGGVEKAIYTDKNGKQTPRWGLKYRGLLYQGLRVELFLSDEDNFGYQFWLRSGPAEANTYLMKWLAWKRAPIRARDGYWWWGEQCLRVASEEDQFALLGMPYIPPGERTERRYKQLLDWNRAHRWPDFSAFVKPLPAQGRLLNDAPTAARTLIQRDLPPGGLLSLEAFRAARDTFVQREMQARLPTLQTQAAALWARYQAARREIEQAGERTKKELENRLYAEDGLAWAWAKVDAEISSIRRALGALKGG